jgi:D-alanine-D-alanine ligase-like ATP-grasp enzyme
MSKKKPRPILVTLIKKLAPKIGATVLIEPEWEIAGQIRFKNGRTRYVRYSTLDLNPVGASDIAKDKDYANFFMRAMGYPTIPGKTFFSKAWAKAIGSRRSIDAGYRYAKQLGFPVIVKPNSGSQGCGVALVRTRAQFYRAMRQIFLQDRVALVQTPVLGKDYRIIVLDGKIISAYERSPLSVTGNGRSTIAQLLNKKQRSFVASSRDTRIKTDDPRITEKLATQGKTMAYVPTRNEQVFLLDNANLSSGGESRDVTTAMHTNFQDIATRLTKDMGLRFCGVDLMIEGDIANPPKRYWVIEINAAPGLDHYANSGTGQKQVVEKMYLHVLKSLETDH